MDWRHEAVCRDEDPELFFPVGNSGPALTQIAKAKLVCNRCPVASSCLIGRWNPAWTPASGAACLKRSAAPSSVAATAAVAAPAFPLNKQPPIFVSAPLAATVE